MKTQQVAVKKKAAFPKKYRLTKTDEYSSVLVFRKAIRSTHFLLNYRLRRAEEFSIARLGIVVPRRFLKRAVDRNLIRRLAKESFRKLHYQLPSRDFILRLMCKPKPLERQAIANEIQGLLEKTISTKR